MALQEQTITLPFTAGMDESADKHAEPSGFLVLRDAQYKQEGGLVRRHGFRQEDFSSSTAPGVALVTDGRAALVRTTDAVRANGGGLPDTAELTELVPFRASSPFGGSVDTLDVCVVDLGGDYAVVQAVSYVDRDNRSAVRVTAYRSDGTVINETLISAASGRAIRAPRLLPQGPNAFVLLYCDLNTGTGVGILYHRIGAVTLASTSLAAAVIITGALSGACFDACNDSDSGWYVVWADSGGTGTDGTLARFDVDGASLASETWSAPVGQDVTLPAVAKLTSGSSDCVVVAYNSAGSDTYVRRHHLTTLALIGSEATGITTNMTASAICVEDVGGGTAVVVVWDEDIDGATLPLQWAAGGPNATRFFYYNDAGTVNGETALGNVAVVTAPWARTTPLGTNRWCIGVRHGHALTGYPTITVLGFDTGGQVARPLGRLSFDESGIAGSLAVNRVPRVPALSATEFLLVGPVNLTAITNRTRASILKFTTSPVARTDLNGLGYIGGANPTVTNGDTHREGAWLFEPEAPFLAAGGAGNPNGVLNYCLVWEWVDSRGNIFVSPPSDPTSITVSSDQVDVSFVTRPFTNRPDDETAGSAVRVRIYRTETAGSVFYLLTTVEVLAAAGTVTTYTDNTADATLTLGETLSLDDVTALAPHPIPPLAHLWTHRNRVFGIRADDPRTVVYTTEATPPTAPGWNSVLSLAVDGTGGDLTAGASMDDKLVLFQADSILVTSGLGPDNTGANGSFGVPERLPTSVGVDVSNRHSVVVTPAGVMFRHRCGIYLLGRDLAVTDIGQPVQTTLGTKVVRRAVVMASVHAVWFVLSGSTDILVYDYRFGRWAVFTAPATPLDAIEVAGVPYLLTDSLATPGQGYILFRYDTTSYADELDEDVWVQPSVETPWVRPAKRGGCGRFYKVHVDGRWEGPGDLEVTTYVQTDDRFARSAETAVHVDTFASDDLTDSVAGAPFSRNVRPRIQRGSAVKVRVRLVEPAGDVEFDSQGVVFTGLRLDVGVEPGAGKTPKRAQRV